MAKVVKITGTVGKKKAAEDLVTALSEHQWAALEAKNLLRCISIATDHGESVSEDLQPSIGVALDGVARLLDLVTRKWDGVEQTAQSLMESRP